MRASPCGTPMGRRLPLRGHPIEVRKRTPQSLLRGLTPVSPSTDTSTATVPSSTST
jgi:hypothetical protein